MIKNCGLLCLLLAMTSTSGTSQTDVKLNTSGKAFGHVQLGVERPAGPKQNGLPRQTLGDRIEM